MPDRVLVLGGCRSGKSRHALALASPFRGGRRIFVATCSPADEEMNRRVALHQAEREADWQTLEVPLALPEALDRHAPAAAVILVDCLTLWVSNLMQRDEDPAALAGHLERLRSAMTRAACPVILVANEVGLGIVPENRLARLFRDAAGQVNAAMAMICNRVLLVVAGIPLPVKDGPPRPIMGDQRKP